MKPKHAILALFFAVLAGGAWLLMSGSGAGTIRYFKAAEYAALEKNPGDCQVHGTVAPGSIERLPVGVRFALVDGATRIPVEYRDIVPDAFAENRELVVEGRGTPQNFQAEKLLVKCPSKYNPADEKKKAGGAVAAAAVPAAPAAP